jgi:hypothetical protein
VRTAAGICRHARGLGICLLAEKTLRGAPPIDAKSAKGRPHAGGLGRVHGTMRLREVTSLGWLNEGDAPVSR